MASIIDSFREVFTDRFSFLKIFALAIPLYYSYQIYLTSNGDLTLFFVFAGLTVFFLFGFLARITNNVINDGESILPALNPLKIGLTAVKSILAIAPSVIISGWLANYACSFINMIEQVAIYFKSTIWLIAISIMVTVFLMFIKDERFLDIFNLKILFTKVGDVAVGILFFLLQFILANGLVMGLIGYTLFILFGYGPLFNSFIALAIVFNVAVTGHYMAQLQYDCISYGTPSTK